MKHFYVMIAMALGVWGCSDTAQPEGRSDLPAVNATGQTALMVSVDRVQLSGGVTLQMPDPPLRELAVRQESTFNYVFIHGPNYDIALWDNKLAPRTLTLDIDQTMGVRFVDGERQLVRAFPEFGHYTIIAADNLETESDNTVSFETALEILAN